MQSGVGSGKFAGLLLLIGVAASASEGQHQKIVELVDARAAHFGEVSRQIWEAAEPGYKETKSAALLADELRRSGFRVRDGIAGIPTPFIAEWGTGKPVIGIMGEYDALPGLSQEVEPEKRAAWRAGMVTRADTTCWGPLQCWPPSP